MPPRPASPRCDAGRPGWSRVNSSGKRFCIHSSVSAVERQAPSGVARTTHSIRPHSASGRVRTGVRHCFRAYLQAMLAATPFPPVERDPAPLLPSGARADRPLPPRLPALQRRPLRDGRRPRLRPGPRRLDRQPGALDLGVGFEASVQQTFDGTWMMWVLNHLYLAAQLGRPARRADLPLQAARGRSTRGCATRSSPPG